MRSLISFNGVLTDSDEKLFNSHSRSYKYGDGFFESIKVINKKPHLFHLHFDRINRASKWIKLPLKEKWTREFFEEQIELLCLKNGLTDARCRITFYRDSDGFYIPESNKAGFIIEVSEYNGKFKLNDKGLNLDQFQQILKPSNFLSFFKPLSALHYVLAGIHAAENNLNSVVVFNEMNRVAEAHNANLFIISDDEIYTPALSEYCIDGVMRNHVISQLRKNNYTVHETMIEESDLFSADEMFLTNATQGILWVENYRDAVFSFHKTTELHSIVFTY